jgi:PD-(D/E)XK nuclease superfamily
MAKNGKYPTYKNSDGKVVPSVTTILSRFKDSGGLLYWANKVGREGLTLDQAREPAATAGTMAHTLVEAHLRDEPEPPLSGDPSVIEKARAAYGSYLKWESMTSLEVRHAEVALVSDKYQFGGRMDAIGVVGNELVLIDWKTSNSVYVDYTLQLAAYQLLWEEAYPDHPLVGGFHLCRFAKEEGDFGHHHFPKLEREAITFLKMRELFDLVKDCERRVK